MGFGGIDLFRSICIQPAHHKSYVWASAMSVVTCLFPTHVLVLEGYRWMLLSTLSAVCAPYAPLTTITRRGTTITRNYLSLYLLSTWYIRLFITPAVQAPVFSVVQSREFLVQFHLNIKTIFYSPRLSKVSTSRLLSDYMFIRNVWPQKLRYFFKTSEFCKILIRQDVSKSGITWEKRSKRCLEV